MDGTAIEVGNQPSHKRTRKALKFRVRVGEDSSSDPGLVGLAGLFWLNTREVREAGVGRPFSGSPLERSCCEWPSTMTFHAAHPAVHASDLSCMESCLMSSAPTRIVALLIPSLLLVYAIARFADGRDGEYGQSLA